MQSVVEDNVATYREIFEITSPDNASDPYWKRALSLFQALPPEQKPIFFEVLRQVCVDTTSNVLGVIDGVNAVEGGTGEFTLIYGGSENLSGDLQSLFRVEEEAKAR